MNDEMINLIEELIAKRIMDAIPGITVSNDTDGNGWDWSYRKISSDSYHGNPLDAFIDYVQIILRANDKLTGGDISYDEDEYKNHLPQD